MIRAEEKPEVVVAGEDATRSIGVTIAFFSDLHLGAPHAPGRDWAEKMVTRVKPDVVVFGGDLVDHRDGGLADITAASGLLSTIAESWELPLVIIWGNHDAEVGLHRELVWITDHPRIRCPEGTDSVQVLSFPGIPVYFYAMNVGEKNDYRAVIDAYPVADRVVHPDVAHVGVFHTSLTGEFSKNPCLPATPDGLLEKRYDAWLLGHVHSPHTISDNPLIGWPGMGHMWQVRF